MRKSTAQGNGVSVTIESEEHLVTRVYKKTNEASVLN